MDLFLEAPQEDSFRDCFLSVRIGQVQKQGRHLPSRCFRFPLDANQYAGRVELLRPIGATRVNVDPDFVGCRDVTIKCKDGLGELKLKVSLNCDAKTDLSKLAYSAKKAADVDDLEASVREKVSHHKEYLRKTGFDDLLTEGMREILQETPEDPCLFLSEWLLAKANARQKTSLPCTQKATSSTVNAGESSFSLRPSVASWLYLLPPTEPSLPSLLDVVVDRSSSETLGIEITHPDGVTLYVKAVAGGLIGKWNGTQLGNFGAGQVQGGDRIIEVNGIRGDDMALLEELKRPHVLEIKIRKSMFFDAAVDGDRTLKDLKTQASPAFASKGKALAPCKESSSSELARLLAAYDEDKDGKLSLDEFSNLARHELWWMKNKEIIQTANPWQPPPAYNGFGGDDDDDDDDDDEPSHNPANCGVVKSMGPVKLGVYTAADGNSVAAFSLRYLEGQPATENHYRFTITAVRRPGNSEKWSAELEPAGEDQSGRTMWTLKGHPSGGVLIRDGDTLIECDQISSSPAMCGVVQKGGVFLHGGVTRHVRTEKRQIWNFREELHGKYFQEPDSLPVDRRSNNFEQAVVQCISSENLPDSPDTQSVVQTYARYYGELPKGPIKRQMELVKLYTQETPLYHEMNKALRSDDLEKMKIFGSYIKELRDVFLTDHEYQIIKPFTGTVWRGISVGNIEEALKKYKPGKDFLWTAFTSTTTSKSVAMPWGDLIFEVQCYPPKGMYDDDEYEYAPADIKEFSVFQNEDEVLFPPNARFRVLEVQKSDCGKPIIVCIATALDGVDHVVEFGNHAEGVVDEHSMAPTSDSCPAAHLADGGKQVPAMVRPIDRVKNRPRLGIYVASDGAVGRLFCQVGKAGRRKCFVFAVTATTPLDPNAAFWCASLVHCGQDPSARDMWTLDGHPEGGFFIHEKGGFIEIDDDEDGRPQRSWAFKGEKPKDDMIAPWAKAFLENELQKAREVKKFLKEADQEKKNPGVYPSQQCTFSVEDFLKKQVAQAKETTKMLKSLTNSISATDVEVDEPRDEPKEHLAEKRFEMHHAGGGNLAATVHGTLLDTKADSDSDIAADSR